MTAFEELEKIAWYVHHTPEGRYYFDRQENLTKLLQSLAQDAPQNQVDDLIRHRLSDMFKATRKTCYDDSQNAGPAPRIYYAEDGPVTESCPQLKDQILPTKALRVSFLVCDPSGQYETGTPVTWENTLTLRNQLTEQDGQRQVELRVAPRGKIRYTLDGSEPRDGTLYEKPISIGDQEILLRAFATADGLEVKKEFRFPARGKQGVQLDPVKPGRIISQIGRKLDSRAKTFDGLKQAAEKSVSFEGIILTVGQGSQMISIQVGEVVVEAAFVESLLMKVLEKFTPDTPVTMSFRKGYFASGHDLSDFAHKLGITLQVGDVEQ